MAVNVPGLVVVLIFYIAILVIGIWASRKSKKVEKTCAGNRSEVTIVGGRNISVLVGVFTMTATWVGGGYILGTAEAVYSPRKGLLWAHGPPADCLTMVLGGLFFAKPMRSKRYVTMLDPFQHRYGNMFTAMLLIPALAGDIIWVACILAALGGTMSVILGLSFAISIIISSAVSIIYTFLGGLYSVVYTDVIQLCFIFFSLALGGVSSQVLYQRILSAASPAQAQVTCFAAAGLCVIMGVPSVVIGAAAATADWNQTAYGLPPPYERGEAGKILPLVLQYLTPSWLSVLGIGSVAAAVMSSVDSALLSSASMFTQNIYKTTLRKQASQRELHWVIRFTVLLVGLAGTGLAFTGDSVFGFWLLSGDLLYCVTLPQLICVLHLSFANSYGAIIGYVVGLLPRLLSGEPMLGIPPVLLFPGWREEDGVITQYFPFRTLIMMLSLICIITVSKVVELGFHHQLIPESWDFLGVFKEKDEDQGKELRRPQEEVNNPPDTEF